jgi:hypothetical protein
MALSYVQYNGDGSTRNFAIPFPYLSTNDVKVALNGAAQTNFSFLSGGGTIQLATAPAYGVTIEIRRVTPRDNRLVDFNDGSVITETDLDLSALQVFYIVQEAVDVAGGTLGIDSDGSFNALGRRITNVADPVGAKNAVNLQYFEGTFRPQLNALVTAAQSARDAAITARDAAAASASSAAQSKTDMAASLTAAQTARDVAITARTDAQAARDAASTSATNAKTSETNAATSAGTATTKAAAASQSATDAATSASSIGTAKTDAQAARDGAVTARDVAVSARTDAQAARDKAQAWAQTAENQSVEAGLYSAYHWAMKAKGFSAGNASTVAFTPSGLIVATNVQDALAELDSKKIAKTAMGTFGATMLGTGTAANARSALDFDNQVFGLVDQRVAATKGSTVLLSEVAPSSANVVNWTGIFSNLDANYDHYILELCEIHSTVADCGFYIRVFTSGGLQSASGNYDYAGTLSRSDANFHFGSNSTTGSEAATDTIALLKRQSGYGLANGTYNSINGEVHFYRPGRTKFRCAWDLHYDGNNGSIHNARGAGRFATNADVTGFQLATIGLTSGTPLMTTGALRLYGIKK